VGLWSLGSRHSTRCGGGQGRDRSGSAGTRIGAGAGAGWGCGRWAAGTPPAVEAARVGIGCRVGLWSLGSWHSTQCGGGDGRGGRDPVPGPTPTAVGDERQGTFVVAVVSAEAYGHGNNHIRPPQPVRESVGTIRTMRRRRRARKRRARTTPSPGSSARPPKEQRPPRNLSGTGTDRDRPLWRAAASRRIPPGRRRPSRTVRARLTVGASRPRVDPGRRRRGEPLRSHHRAGRRDRRRARRRSLVP
jgi:hypothetical protein